MRAMSTVSASVTRSPSRNSGVLPRRPISAQICGPPPCTTTGRMPTRRISTMSWANSVEGVVLGRAGEGVAAVLDDDGLAGEAADVRQRLDEDGGPSSATSPTLVTAAARRRQAGGLVEAEGDVGGLERAAGRTLGEVVEGAEHDDVAGALVEAGGDEGRVRARASPSSTATPAVTTTNGSSRYALRSASSSDARARASVPPAGRA